MKYGFKNLFELTPACPRIEKHALTHALASIRAI